MKTLTLQHGATHGNSYKESCLYDDYSIKCK